MRVSPFGILLVGIKFLALQYTLLHFIFRVEKKFFKYRKNITYYLFLDYKLLK